MAKTKTSAPSASAPAVADSKAPQPIGVPVGYQAPVPVPGLNQMSGATLATLGSGNNFIPPRYYDGSQFLPASQLSVDDMIDLQKQLEAGGWYPNNSDITWGVWGPTEVAAYQNVLATANRSGSDSKTVLAQSVASRAAHPPKDTRAPLVVKLTSPTDIKAVTDQVSQNLYGANLPDAAKDAIVSGFQAQERDSQTSAYNMGDPTVTGVLGGVGGEVVKPPDPSTYAQEQIKQQFPNQVAATAFGNHMDAIMSTLTSSPQRPTQGIYG